MASSETQHCPSCGTLLTKKMTRKTKCPSCGEFIYVRKGELVTEDEASIRDWLVKLESLSIDRAAFDKNRDALTTRFNKRASINDNVYDLARQAVAAGRHSSWAYSIMVDIMKSEGRDFKELLRAKHAEELAGLKSNRVKSVRVMGANDSFSCPECRALWTQTIDIDAAITEMPVPNQCTCETGCRCWYSAAEFLPFQVTAVVPQTKKYSPPTATPKPTKIVSRPAVSVKIVSASRTTSRPTSRRRHSKTVSPTTAFIVFGLLFCVGISFLIYLGGTGPQNHQINSTSAPAYVYSTSTPFPTLAPGSHPAGAYALCNDGSYWDNPEHRGACNGHKGVAVFYK